MTSDQLRIIKQIRAKIHSKLSIEYSNLDAISAVDWLEITTNILNLMKSDYYRTNNDFIGCFIITISLDKIGESRNIFNTDFLKDLNESGLLSKSNFIEIDIKGNLVEKLFNHSTYELDELSELSENNENNVFFRLDNNSLFTFGKGKLISSIPDINTLISNYRFNNKISTNEIDVILKKFTLHFDTKIPPSLYWQNKKLRKLKKSPEQFLGYLFLNFLTDNLSDGDVTSESLVSGSDDKLDVRVLNLNNKNLNIYEVKWIGRSEKTEYINEKAHKRANDGIEQLHLYLKNEHNCENAILVLYDARFENENENIKWLDESKWNAKIYKPPYILFLKSENASTIATKTVEEKFKKNKDAPK